MRPPVEPSLLSRLYDRSGAARWGLPADVFNAAVERSVARAFAGKAPETNEVTRYAGALHLEDLALAVACATGIEAAWEHFIREHRPALYRAADAMDPSGGARELADGLYADLFGLAAQNGIRRSLFRYFHGRSRLVTWLSAVLSQRLIDRGRDRRRVEPLSDDDANDPPRIDASMDPERADYVTAMKAVLRAAVAALDARDRLRLGCYYVQGLTLATIGRLFHEHEATVSRHLARTRLALGADVRSRLARDWNFDNVKVAECVRSMSDDAGPIDLGELVGATSAGRKNGDEDRSK
jgi:RNA polymerase sigma-70 factor